MNKISWTKSKMQMEVIFVNQFTLLKRKLKKGDRAKLKVLNKQFKELSLKYIAFSEHYAGNSMVV